MRPCGTRCGWTGQKLREPHSRFCLAAEGINILALQIWNPIPRTSHHYTNWDIPDHIPSAVGTKFSNVILKTFSPWWLCFICCNRDKHWPLNWQRATDRLFVMALFHMLQQAQALATKLTESSRSPVCVRPDTGTVPRHRLHSTVQHVMSKLRERSVFISILVSSHLRLQKLFALFRFSGLNYVCIYSFRDVCCPLWLISPVPSFSGIIIARISDETYKLWSSPLSHLFTDFSFFFCPKYELNQLYRCVTMVC
jgi:hypothetical protein